MKKRSAPWIWSDDEDDNSGSDSSHSDSEDNKNESQDINVEKLMCFVAKKKKRELDFEALRKHGYKGGPSVLSVPAPKEADGDKDWSWSKGEESRKKESEETYDGRLKTRAALEEAEQLAHVQTAREKRELSFAQKEKRKRELGQASRGKNYVEEEKRLLRDSGVFVCGL